jgi:hypothetical protein
MPPRIATPCDRALRQALRNRKESLRAIDAKTGIRFTTLANYEKDDGEASKDGVSYKTHITLEQAEALARYFGMKLELVKT